MVIEGAPRVSLLSARLITFVSIVDMAGMSSENWSQLLRDKVVFVTGGGGGIGSAICQTCALQGAKVVVSDIDKAATDRVVAGIAGDPDRTMSVQLDTIDEQAIEQAVQQVVAKWGTVDVLVNAYV